MNFVSLIGIVDNYNEKTNDKKLQEWANNMDIKLLKDIIDNLGNEFNILCDVWQKRMNNGQSRQDYKKKR